MKFIEYGNISGKTVMLIHGMGCEGVHSFRFLIDKLKNRYRVIVVCLDGHDEPTTTFTSIENQAEKISSYLYEHNIDRLHTLLGMSMGGFIAIDLIERYGVNTDKLILDSGYLKPWSKTAAAVMAKSVSKTYISIIQGKCSITGVLGMKIFMGYSMKKEDMCPFASAETIYNSEYSCLTYKLPLPDKLTKTKIEFWCGKKDRFMKSGMKLLKAKLPHFKQVYMGNYGHAELMMEYPEKYAQNAAKKNYAEINYLLLHCITTSVCTVILGTYALAFIYAQISAPIKSLSISLQASNTE